MGSKLAVDGDLLVGGVNVITAKEDIFTLEAPLIFKSSNPAHTRKLAIDKYGDLTLASLTVSNLTIVDSTTQSTTNVFSLLNDVSSQQSTLSSNVETINNQQSNIFTQIAGLTPIGKLINLAMGQSIDTGAIVDGRAEQIKLPIAKGSLVTSDGSNAIYQAYFKTPFAIQRSIDTSLVANFTDTGPTCTGTCTADNITTTLVQTDTMRARASAIITIDDDVTVTGILKTDTITNNVANEVTVNGDLAIGNALLVDAMRTSSANQITINDNVTITGNLIVNGTNNIGGSGGGGNGMYVGGRVNADGSIVSQKGSVSFTVTKVGTGLYDISFPALATNDYVIMLTASVFEPGGSPVNASYLRSNPAPTTSGFRVACNYSDGTQHSNNFDSEFHLAVFV